MLALLKDLKYPKLHFELVGALKNEITINLQNCFKRFFNDAVNQSNLKVLNLTFTLNSDKISGSPYHIIVSVDGIFEIIGNFNQQEFEITATEQLFPYLRNAVSTIMSNAGFPPIYLPPINDKSLFNNDNLSISAND